MEICCMHDSQCEGESIKLGSLSVIQKYSIISVIRYLNKTLIDELFVCERHLELYVAEYEQRRRRKRCEVDSLFHGHPTDKRLSADRHVTIELHEKILSSSGVFVPLGTAICRRCREKLVGKTEPCKKELSKEMAVLQDSASEGEIDSVHVRQQDRKRRKVDRNQYLTIDSQSTDGENSSQNSVERLQRYDKLDCLNRYLNFDKMSPIHKMTKPFSQCTRKTQTYYTRKTEKTFRSIVKTISFGGKDEEIWNNITPLLKTDKMDNLLVKIYGECEASWQLRRQILSIVTKDKTFDEAQKSVPSLTKWRFYESRKHATSVGVGLPISDTPIKRDRVDEVQLDHFLDFITSTHVLKDLPYGEKTLRLQSREIIQIPNVVRSLAATSLIKQYDQLCEEEDVLPLGKSTMYRILTECAASVRQCVEGLDNYVMEGSRAFQDLELHIEEFEIHDLKTRLLDAKRYLRTDFKIHLSGNRKSMTTVLLLH